MNLSIIIFYRRKFRINYEKELIEIFDRGHLVHAFVDRVSFLTYIKQVNKQDWQLHLEPAIQTPSEVIRYIGRYSKRACISEHKITKMEGDYISFQYKDYRDRDSEGKPKIKELTLHYRKFIPRLLQHVPPPLFQSGSILWIILQSRTHCSGIFECGDRRRGISPRGTKQSM